MTWQLKIGKYIGWVTNIIWWEIWFFLIEWGIFALVIMMVISFTVEDAGANKILICQQVSRLVTLTAIPAFSFWVIDFGFRLHRGLYARRQQSKPEDIVPLPYEITGTVDIHHQEIQ